MRTFAICHSGRIDFFFYGFNSNIKLNGSRASTGTDENLCVLQIFDIALQIENAIQCIRSVAWMRALPLKLKTMKTINEITNTNKTP